MLCVLTSIICCYFTILYGLKYGWQKSWQWLMTAVASMVLSIAVVQPFKMAIFAFVYARFLGVSG